MARDLHTLTHDEGLEPVARVCHRSSRSLRDARAGVTPLTVDDLYRLRLRWDDFDILATVMRIGATRSTREGAP